jgi:hypothetical protein
MKSPRKTFVILSLALLASSAGIYAQGTFQNLDFESANIPNATQPGSLVPVGMALPGWSVNVGSVSNGIVTIPYDSISLGGALISVLDTNAGLGFVPLQGKYTAALFGGSSTAATIDQTGLVPIGSQSLQLAVYSVGAPFVVMLGGQTINMVPLSQVTRTGFPASYTIYGGDISSSLAGQMEQLSISELTPAGTPPSELFLDDIIFSPSMVPEPSTFGLFCIGGLLFGLYHRQAK